MAGFGWATYVVPAWQLRKLIESHKQQLNQEWHPVNGTSVDGMALHHGSNEDDGWVSLLAHRMQVRGDATTEANRRWIYRVMNEESIVCEAERTDHVCIAMGVMMEFTDLQVFPGNRRLARDVVEIEAEMNGTILDRKQIEKRIDALLEARDIVVYKYGIPEATQRLAEGARRRRAARKEIPATTEQIGERVAA